MPEGVEQPAVVAQDLSLVFQTADTPVTALSNVNLRIERGEFVSFIGPSGCGKTTLMRVIADLEKPTSGSMQVNGVSAEEARLAVLGCHMLIDPEGPPGLVVDIGGRSTELILGQGFDARVMESYRVGSVAWSMRYFPDAQFTPMAFKMAEIAAKAVLDEALNAYRRSAWDVACA